MKLLRRIQDLAENGIAHPWKAGETILLSVLVLCLGIVVGLVLDMETGRHESSVFLMPAIVLAAGLGGFIPGLVLTAIAVIFDATADFYISGFEARSFWTSMAFAAMGVIMSGGGHLFRQALINAAKVNLEIQRREADLRAIVDTVPDSLVMIDHEGIIARFSPGAQKQFGWEAEEVVGQNVSMLMPSPYREQHPVFLKREIDTQASSVLGRPRLLAGLRKDGTSFPIEVSVGELEFAGEHHFVGFIRDLTERQKAEARMHELQNELFHVSRLSALGQLASALAHEINQPLSAIANYIAGAKRLAAKGSDPALLDEVLDHAGKEAIRAGETIRKLRSFLSRGESEMRPENLAELVDEATTIALVGSRTRKVRLKTKLSPLCPIAIVDKVQIQQVLINLIRNAVEATSERHTPRLLIETAPTQSGMILCSVTDNGTGISSDVAGQLFQPFVTSKKTGMGVGLSITRSIVEAHGGHIWTEPNPDGGTIFRFTVRGQDPAMP